MRREQFTLPTLQIAAAAFFAASVNAESYCVDNTSKVVAKPNCDASEGGHAPGTFFLREGPPGVDIGATLPGGEKTTRATVAERRAAIMAEKRFVVGGFGKRDDDCDKDTDPNCGGGS